MGPSTSTRMTVGVTGASGLVGSVLIARLTDQGHRAVPIPRDRTTGRFRVDDLAGSLEAVVHLAGEPIAGGRWTAAKMARIYDSRVEGTRHLSAALAQWTRRPRAIVSASAVGYYGNRGDQLLDEQSGPGQGFLPRVVRDWEQALEPAKQEGIRTVSLRFGIILDRRGGALAKMLRPFRWGLGGRIGHGRQYWSWIALEDALAAIGHVLTEDRLAGPVNVVSPRTATNAEFTAALGQALHRPTLATMPAWAVRILLGRMGVELLLASARVEPRRLIESGFTFHYDRLDDALRHALAAEWTNSPLPLGEGQGVKAN